MLPDQLTDAENALWRAFPSGDWVDLRVGAHDPRDPSDPRDPRDPSPDDPSPDDPSPNDPSPDDVSGGASWGPERTVRAVVIRALLLEASERTPGHYPAVRLRGARVSGRLDLMGAVLDYALICEGCYFDEPVRLVEAGTRTVRIVGSRLPSINAARMRVDGILNLFESRIEHGVRLDRARVTGEVSLRGAVVGGDPDGIAVAADGLVVEGNVECNAGFTATGTIRLRGARLTGSMDMVAARLDCPGGEALDARNLTVDGWFAARQLTVDGEFKVANAVIAGWLDLSTATLRNPGQVAFSGGGMTIGGGLWCNRGFTAHGEIRLIGARLSANLTLVGAELINPGGTALNLERAALADLDAEGLTVSGGRITLVGAEISSRVNLRHARLDDGPAGTALLADGVTVGDVLSLADAHVRGVVTFRTARIAGRLLLVRARLDSAGVAVRMSRAEVGADMYCNGMVAEGGLRLNGATIGRHLSMEGIRLAAREGFALEARSLTVGEFTLRGPVEGAVDLRHARVGVLRDDPDHWPRPLHLDGLTYEAIEPGLPARRRLNWLSRDPDGCPPQPYEQLAALYTRIGQPAEARAVLYARERRQRATKSPIGRVWSGLQDVTVGYGYRSFRAVWWFALLLAVGSVTYGLAPPDPLKRGEAPHFNGVVYPLDLLLPIVDLGQQNAFNPAGAQQWFSYVLIAAGWVLATTIATGLARVLTRR